jgi:hypothetical protein
MCKPQRNGSRRNDAHKRSTINEQKKKGLPDIAWDGHNTVDRAIMGHRPEKRGSKIASEQLSQGKPYYMPCGFQAL